MKMAQTNNMLLHLFISALLLLRAALLPIDDQRMAPSMTDIERIMCPSDRQFKCLPYGACCRGSEFCHSGLCESCFPRQIPGSGLLAWCRATGQYNVSTMRSPACRLACQDVFTSLQLAVIEDKGHEASTHSPTDHRGNNSQEVKENTSTLTDTISPQPLGARQQTDTDGQGTILQVLVAGNVITLVFVIILVCISWDKILSHISNFKNLILGSRNDNQQLQEVKSFEPTSISDNERAPSAPSTPAAVEGEKDVSHTRSNEHSGALPSPGQATSNTASNHTQTDLPTSLSNGNVAGNALMVHIPIDCNTSSNHTQTDLLTSLSYGNVAGNALLVNRPIDCNTSSNHTQTDYTTSLNNGNEADNALIGKRLNDCNMSSNRGRFSSEMSYNRNTPSDISSSLGKRVRNASMFEERTPRNKSSDQQASCNNKQRNYNELRAKTDNAVNEFKEGSSLNTEHPVMSSEDPRSSSSYDGISHRATIYDGLNEAGGAVINDETVETDFIAIHNSPTQPKETVETSLCPEPRGSKVREHLPVESIRQHNEDVIGSSSMSNEIPRAGATNPTQDLIEPEDGDEKTPLLNHDSDIKPQEESKLLETK